MHYFEEGEKEILGHTMEEPPMHHRSESDTFYDLYYHFQGNKNILAQIKARWPQGERIKNQRNLANGKKQQKEDDANTTAVRGRFMNGTDWKV